MRARHITAVVLAIAALGFAFAGPALADPVTDPDLPRSLDAGPVTVSPQADLAHRRLVARAEAGGCQPDLADLAADLVARLLPPPERRPSHRAVDEVRVALNADPQARLDDLAELAGCSRWHLSRTFHEVTGMTINTYRPNGPPQYGIADGQE